MRTLTLRQATLSSRLRDIRNVVETAYNRVVSIGKTLSKDIPVVDCSTVPGCTMVKTTVTAVKAVVATLVKSILGFTATLVLMVVFAITLVVVSLFLGAENTIFGLYLVLQAWFQFYYETIKGGV